MSSELWGAGCTSGGVMVIGDKLALYEEKTEKLFDTESGKWLLRYLKEHGIDLNKVYFTKCIKSYIGKKAPTKEQREEAYSAIVEEVLAVKPSAILALGAIPLQCLMKTTAITKHRGKKYELCGIPTVFTYTSRTVMRDKSKESEFDTDVNYFKTLASGFKAVEPETRLILTRAELWAVRSLVRDDDFSYDIETPPGGGRVLMIGLCTKSIQVVIPFDSEWCVLLTDFTQADVIEVLSTLFKIKKGKAIAHYSKFDNADLVKSGVRNVITDEDTFLMAYLLGEPKKGLKELSRKYFGASDYDAGIEFKETLTEEEFRAMAQYCGLDCYYTLKLYNALKEQLDADEGLSRVYRYIVMPAERVLQKVQLKGVYVDKKRLTGVLEDYTVEREEWHTKVREAVPKGFEDVNLNSPKQLQELLFKTLRLPVVKATPSGEPSTDKETLLKLADKHPVPKAIYEYRKYEKSVSSFLEPWLNQHLGEDSRLHTKYNVARTSTGRLSAEDPNLQQVPRDKIIRSLISVPDGYKLLEADYSQIELRCAAFIANDPTMREAYKNGEDIHAKTAAEINHCDIKDVTYEMRTGAKAVNFGYLYGMWWKAFKDYAFMTYGITVTDEEAQHSRNAYFRTYYGLERWHERQRREAKKFKYVKTPTGRIRLLPNVDSPDYDLRGGAERQAINTPVQSLASEMMLLAMILIDKHLTAKYKDTASIVGQIHDAILVEVKEEKVYEVGSIIKQIMERVPEVLKKYFEINFDIPIVADIQIGDGWGIGRDLKEFKKDA